MAKVGRNDPCPCGSGRKSKRCCGVRAGPSEESLARAFVARASVAPAGRLRRLTDGELLYLFEELFDLPATDLSLQVRLPKALVGVLDDLCTAVADDDPDEDLLDDAAAAIDTPIERARLARAVLELAGDERIDARLADAALVDLASSSRQLLRAGLLHAIAVRAGAARTPAGILLAA